MSRNILVMGAAGQIGSELTVALRSIYGKDSVIASDIATLKGEVTEGPSEFQDCIKGDQTLEILKNYNIGTIYNLPSLLSVSSEDYPKKSFEVNLIGLHNTLEAARLCQCAVFTPSTIGVFGENTPKKNTPQDTIMRPKTMYGVTKLSGELLCDYYHKKYNLDTRGVRYPGVISHKTKPGGGTTNFAVEIFIEAVKSKSYTSYIAAKTYLDMMYIPDAISAAIELMETAEDKLIHRNAFNVTAMSVDVEMIAKEIKKHIPEFILTYDIDPIRQNIADHWPDNMDDSEACKQWGWNPKYTLEKMTQDILKKLSISLNSVP